MSETKNNTGKYYLIDDAGYATYIIDIEQILRIEDNSVISVNFNVWEANSWNIDTNEVYEKSFVAQVLWKWDNCTHWSFYGMDYDPDIKDSEKDSYYHICGSLFVTRWMIMFAFVRSVMIDICGDKCDDYKDSDKELDRQLLKGYTIKYQGPEKK